MKASWWMTALLLTAGTPRQEEAASPAPDAPVPEAARAPDDEALAGGGTTVFDASHNAYGRALGNLARSRWFQMREGKVLFMRDWAAHEAGLAGPLTNATGCGSCHFKDGRGRPLPDVGPEAPLLVRLSVPAKDSPAGRHEPVYGVQLNDRGTQDVPAEGTLLTTYADVKGTYADGTPYTLRKPRHRITRLGYGKLAPGVMLSPRIPSQLFGLGLLAAIPDEAILALADADDRDGDGISGRPNRVVNADSGKAELGRFGWKANQPTLEQQVASAFSEDLGLTSPLYPESNCTAKQKGCLTRVAAKGPALSRHVLERTTLYLRLIGVPARRDVLDPTVMKGQVLFQQAGCPACHQREFTTGTVEDVPELSNQRIRPYTDLLLHDMGPELADGRPDGEASGAEWRTPPLWGLGLLETVNRQVRMLHDGRARSFEEAILWHGGEGTQARERFKALDKAEREALVAFLRTL
ncbi:di-heme oxidoredictase family protein [Corallococcus macrosporus]|uniref:Thiol oxidoreductase n=1 Tax=Corallococcus macrosporus DSM 14697 TaxID=1189310 RepID=A0A250K3R7_9BACT|nr:di-heme oxidoredictase family protein [Corallococcus macrosporus]ATB50734.1 thiol oxidoreductase [Corallococcus macrosporus DSM 14697]